jgi:ATP-dependent DNA ligase
MFFQAMPLGRKPEPFDDPEWIYELKYDGFRAVAVVQYGHCTLFSRNGHPFPSFSELASQIGYALMPRKHSDRWRNRLLGPKRAMPVQ